MVIGSISFEMAKPESANVVDIANLINDVYTVAEHAFWIDGHKRTDAEQVTKLVNQGKILCAHEDGKLVGVVQVRIFDESIGWFGMLACSENHRGKGIGRGLLNHAESFVKDRGCNTMQCEILVPEQGVIEDKVQLAGWYSRLGYRLISSGNFDALYPKAVPDLKMKCKLDLYLKEL
jgi:GNAT superfamily N-acetyltransferase